MRSPALVNHSLPPSLNDRWRFARYIAPGLLMLLIHHGALAGEERPGASRESNRPEVSRAESAPLSVEELACRLQRLEQQNAKLVEQNQQLVRELSENNSRNERQNAKLGEKNQRLDQQLKIVTGQCEQLNQRLEQIEPAKGSRAPGLPAPPPLGAFLRSEAARRPDTDEILGNSVLQLEAPLNCAPEKSGIEGGSGRDAKQSGSLFSEVPRR
jgi:hypothetical protein